MQLTLHNLAFMPKQWILPVIVVAQFFCTSLWFAGNAVIRDMLDATLLTELSASWLTSAVQLGFIAGTLTFAFLTLADRFSPSWVFFFSAIGGAMLNLGITVDGLSATEILTFRVLTGFCLAGIYPVGMKIAADHYPQGLGKALGFLVGALVLGTALPHLLRSLSASLPWKLVLYLTSLLAFLGGTLLVVLVPDGAVRRVGQKPDWRACTKVFASRAFRKAAFGYFGHMWELYAFWTFVPAMLSTYQKLHPHTYFNVFVWSFVVIGVGSMACVVGGYVSLYVGIKKTAVGALLLSGICCLVSPLLFQVEVPEVFIGFLLFWGMVVIADSPLFSALIAHNAAPESKATALTIVTCLGFSITIVSIQLLGGLMEWLNSPGVYMVLALGPVVGLYVGGTKELDTTFGK